MLPVVTLTLDENSSVEYVFSDVKLRCRTPRQEPGGAESTWREPSCRIEPSGSLQEALIRSRR
jgi:hypothetical protein